MNSQPYYLLFSESSGGRKTSRGCYGRWRFVLERVDGEDAFEAADFEPETQGERLELLAVVRGLEALDQPSRVTLMTRSKYVRRGIRHGLPEWRENDWHWERFGRLAPVKNRDLWRRIDRALEFHQLECRRWRFDQSARDEFGQTVPPPASHGLLRRNLSRPNSLRRLAAAGQSVATRRAEVQESLAAIGG